MMESLDFTSIWGAGGEETGICIHNLPPGDGLDGLLDDLPSDLLFKPNDVAPGQGDPALGDFEDWLDLKIDFSLWDFTEDQNNTLNDPLVMEKVHETDLPTPKGQRPSTILYAAEHLSTYTPPSSPESQVPDTNRPIKIANISCDHNLFASPPESPNHSSGSVANNFVLPPASPSAVLEVVIQEDKAVVSCLPPPTSVPQFVDVRRQRDSRLVAKRPHPYALPEGKAPAASVLKSKVKSASGSSSRTSSNTIKKERKRAQNKDAATRYREKKRTECKSLEKEEDVLEEANQKLKAEINKISTEISYLKGFMRDMFRARGLLK